MSGLLEVADVIRGDENLRVEGLQYDKVACSLGSWAVDICAPNRGALLSGFDTGLGEGLDNLLFAAVVQMRGRAMCRSGSEEQTVEDAMDAEAEKSAGVALWNGLAETNADPNKDAPFLLDTDVFEVAAAADAEGTLAALLDAFWTRVVGVPTDQTILHLGPDRLLRMIGKGLIAEGRVKEYNLRVAASPGYTPNAMALTGPVEIRMGPDQILTAHDVETNGLLTEGTRLLSMYFDPCQAVRAAEPV